MPSAPEAPSLDLAMIAGGMAPGLTAERGAAMAQAARVCLTQSGHQSPCPLTVDEDRFRLMFAQAVEAEEASWNDAEEATQQGAYALAILIIRRTDNLTVVERSRRGTHFDWWLGSAGSGPLFQQKVHLEVSGIRDGSDARIDARVTEKSERFGDAPPPHGAQRRVVVVEYSRPLARTKKL